ncbi:MAG: oligopeptide:H+ symporter, partial [Rikenellaceae bacterium]
MFKGHPRGLFVLALSNMGERFGYYTMLAIFVLFLQAKFGLSTDETSTIFGTFLALVYFLPVIGGYIADRFLGYGKTITLGIVIMFFGYFVLAIPTGVDNVAFITMIGALALIAIGTGLFKGNVQALVGNLYDNPKYSKKRDLAYSLFYMCINIGAFFAPSAAKAISNYFLAKHGLFYNAQIPSLANQYISGTISESGLTRLSELANAQITGASENISSFATTYIQRLS